MKHFLETLGVSEDATWEQIKEGYRDQIRVWHPDRFVGDQRLHAKSEEMTKEIHYALRRLKELKSDIEALGYSVEDTSPFLQQYYLKTRGGKGPHGQATFEDRSRGYLQDSFARWDGIVAKVKGDRKTNPNININPNANKLKRNRKTTIKITRKRRRDTPKFLAGAGVLLLLASIGALHLPRLLETISQSEHKSVQIGEETNSAPAKENAPNTPEINPSRPQSHAIINSSANETRPALITAAMNCDLGKTRSLIKEKQQLDIVDNAGQTPLMWAAKRNCAEVAKLLIKNGANPSIQSANGFTALRWAEWYKNSDTSRTLERLGIKQ